MYKVYIIQSLKDKRTYVGYINDLNRRLVEHNSGQNKSTKNRIPFKLLFSEEFENIEEAKKRELWWKNSSGRKKLKGFFENRQNGDFLVYLNKYGIFKKEKCYGVVYCGFPIFIIFFFCANSIFNIRLCWHFH